MKTSCAAAVSRRFSSFVACKLAIHPVFFAGILVIQPSATAADMGQMSSLDRSTIPLMAKDTAEAVRKNYFDSTW